MYKHWLYVSIERDQMEVNKSQDNNQTGLISVSLIKCIDSGGEDGL